MKILYIYDCVDGRLSILRNLPTQAGNTPRCTCRLNMNGDAGIFMNTGASGCTFYPQLSSGQSVEVNGQVVTGPIMIEDEQEMLICVGDGMFVAYLSARMEQEVTHIFSHYVLDSWYLAHPVNNTWMGPWPLQKYALPDPLHQSMAWVAMVGMQKGRTHARKLHEIAKRKFSAPGAAAVPPAYTPAAATPAVVAMPTPAAVATPPAYTPAAAAPAAAATPTPAATVTPPAYIPAAAAPAAAAETPAESAEQWPAEPVDEESGNYTCPVCWLRFSAGDVMNIAAHPDLMGDPVLGRDKMKRFLATRFNARGQALDESGTPCPDIACPHCRSQLPPHFLESRSHIFSIIGAPSAGKSYYLASLIHEMELVLAREGFPLSWRDSDPVGNSMLNDVSYRLFNAPTPETAYLTKTDLEGALYSEFYRHGRMVKLPKPFVYDLTSLANPSVNASFIFYDNAGEHFEPGRNSEDSPGARHVAVADGLFFLFDPVSSPSFRRTIGEHSDPQLAPDAPMRMDQQNIIMAETLTRISSILNLSPGQRIDVPLAIILGKSDLWLDKLEGELRPILKDGYLDQAAVDANSALLRKFLLHLHPSLCTTAETLSSHVRYFAVSPLGCSPVKFFDEASGSDKIGPNPLQIAPQRVCEPTIWALSLIEPGLIPSL